MAPPPPAMPHSAALISTARRRENTHHAASFSRRESLKEALPGLTVRAGSNTRRMLSGQAVNCPTASDRPWPCG